MMAEALAPRVVNRQTKVRSAAAEEAKALKPTAVIEDKYALPPPATVADPSGTTYCTGRKLGKGGFAICYEAETDLDGKNGRTNAKMALKIVKTRMNKKVEDKFRTELQIHSKMRHRHIVEFHRAFTLDESTYVVLGLCSNGSLKDMCQARKYLSLPEIRRYAVQICGAMHYMHSRSIVHRDLKMGNIFLDENMDLKIGDFGLAAVLVTADEMGAVIRRTTLCGTPNYIAPEVLKKGKEGHDFKADVWSFGVLLYTLMVGSTPFSRPGDQDNKAVFERVSNGEWAWPERCSQTLCDEARDLVHYLLQTDEKLRPEAKDIVRHPFFSMSGGIPAVIERTCLTRSPLWLDRKAPREMRPGSAQITLSSLLELSGLGAPEPGSDTGVSVYHEFLVEEASNRTPVIPLKGIYEQVTKQSNTSKPRQVSRSKSKIALSKKEPKSTNPESRSVSGTTVASFATLSSNTYMLSSRSSTTMADPMPNLQRMVDNMSAAMKVGGEPEWLPERESRRPSPIMRWCNYSGRQGLGYVTADGTIGCICLKRCPTKTVVVNNAIRHWQTMRGMASTTSLSTSVSAMSSTPSFSSSPADPVLPTDGPQIHLYERDQYGFLRQGVKTPGDCHMAAMKAVATITATTTSALPRRSSTDQQEQELGQAYWLWSRFAEYFAPKVLTDPRLDKRMLLDGAKERKRVEGAGGYPAVEVEQPVMMVYQRVGNVSVFWWSDGSVQVDFPDHSKLLISGNGVWADYYYLPSKIARELQRGGSPSAEEMRLPFRAKLAMPLGLMLATAEEEECDDDALTNLPVREITKSNELVDKVRWTRDLVVSWMRGGRVGKSGRDKMIWSGLKWPLREGEKESVFWSTMEM